MLMGEIAKRTGLTKKAICYYIEQGLLHPVGETESGYRHFTTEELQRLLMIRELRELERFKLPAEMEGLFDLLSDSTIEELIEQNRKQALELLAASPEKLAAIADRLREHLHSQPNTLSQLASMMRDSKRVLSQAGYYEEIPPLMKRISPLYAEYVNRLEQLQERLPVQLGEQGYHLL
ncbi:MerR family transcriptional regulator [Brevibacillus humidisoli]|uniref:helix-turn-helix domain-containing protein n=1 Tax=Brevibacillus humidisoli TaxID=2895522 RepID=UPI001E3D22E0|nr:MerR family transcriptional regulator [Brevibacillus humidisoli]UFJ42672.1 MerR family transcriptional regulator [Brevibacillus humidisoli]